jgi:hypothetical protein
MRVNATSSSSAIADVRLVSAISAGSSESERFAVSMSTLVWSIRRIAITAIPASARVTITMQIWARSGMRGLLSSDEGLRHERPRCYRECARGWTASAPAGSSARWRPG